MHGRFACWKRKHKYQYNNYTARMTTQPLVTHFPLPRPHCGPTLGNGRQGLLVWGETTLRLTVARAGFWDHRGGQVMLPTTTFATVRDDIINVTIA